MNAEDVEKIYNTILSANITDKNAKKEHVKIIKSNVNERKSIIKKEICPKCGGDLVGRNGKYGFFKGCSNFPKCRFILK
ncbi:MAG: topoisomerase DNA-binding C4 zinc finger domain-containing protein [Clostridia bacterium]|nr:topoisomerase DNA-binding C4 zinc finger domain-containing protein [Clostridia bacterium]